MTRSTAADAVEIATVAAAAAAMSVIRSRETTTIHAARHFVTLFHQPARKVRCGHISLLGLYVPRTGRPRSNEVIHRQSPRGAASINLEYLMHANE